MHTVLFRLRPACDAAAGLVILSLYPIAVDRLTQLHNQMFMSAVHDRRPKANTSRLSSSSRAHIWKSLSNSGGPGSGKVRTHMLWGGDCMQVCLSILGYK